MFLTYILYSVTIDAYYVGSTSDLMAERLRRHNSSHKGFTGRASDWIIAYTEAFPTKAKALKREKEIKSKKSRTYIINLISSAGSEHSGLQPEGS